MVTVDEMRAVALALPRTTEGYRWALVGLAAIDADEMRALVEDAWAFVVPKRVAEEYAASHGYR